MNIINNVSRKWRLGAQCPTTPGLHNKPQPGVVNHPSGLPYPHSSHKPPHGNTPEHPSHWISQWKRRKRNERKENRGVREGTQRTNEKQHLPNARRHKQATHMGMHLLMLTHRNNKHGYPWRESYKNTTKNAGNVKVDTGNANNAMPLPSRAWKRWEC